MDVQVTARGKVASRTKRLARDEFARLDRYVSGSVIAARVVLIQEENPRIPTPARAEGEIVLKGHVVRAHSSAPTMDAAVDDLAERLQRQMRRFIDRRTTLHREPAESPPGEWRHSSLRSKEQPPQA